MNGFTENRTPEASERPGSHDLVLTWGTCHAMLPLVGRIAADIARHAERLLRLQPEQARLDRRRHTLAWPERARRYQLQEEISQVDKELRQAHAELDSLGVVILHAPTGLVGFPTLVDDRRAYFTWRPGEEDVTHWSFAGEDERHTVPDAWTRPPRERPRKGKPRRSR
jgi:hypothetical protein